MTDHSELRQRVLSDMSYLENHGADQGIAAIIAERRRQIEVKGYGAAHDDRHDQGEMLGVARYCLTLPDPPPSGIIRAAALCAAELDRLARAEPAVSGMLRRMTSLWVSPAVIRRMPAGVLAELRSAMEGADGNQAALEQIDAELADRRSRS